MLRRTSSITATLQNGGPFTGDNKPTTRITVTPNWYLNTTTGPFVGYPSNKVPVRYWQNAVGNGHEIEIPNISKVMIDRQLAQQADTIEVDFYNIRTPANGSQGPSVDVFGDRGYLGPFYGESALAQQRWGQTANSWSNILRENSLLRVYQGYGGWTHPDGTVKTIEEAYNDGSVMLTGVFLVDAIAIESQSGMGKLTGRSMAKLLIDQAAWPPLVPPPFYTSAGIVYYHDLLVEEPAVGGYGSDGTYPVPSTAAYTGTGNVNYTVVPGDSLWEIAVKFYGNGADWPTIYDANKAVVGSNPNLIFPGQVLTIPNVSRTTNVTWPVNTKSLQGETLTVYDMCVMPDGQGYRLATSDGYVYNYGTAAENGFVTGLGGTPLAGKIIGIEGTPSGKGYWLCGQDGGVFAFGDAAYLGRVDPSGTITTGTTTADTSYTVVSGDTLWAIAQRFYNNPYDWPTIWKANTFITNPNLIYPGQVLVIPGISGTTQATLAKDVISLRRTPSGKGYWQCQNDGGVFTFGDAAFYGSVPGIATDVCVGFAVRPQGDGYWILAKSGKVYHFGNAEWFGDWQSIGGSPNVVTSIDPAPDGNGYRILTYSGEVSNFGSAAYLPLNGVGTWEYPSGCPAVELSPFLTDVTLNAPCYNLRGTPDGNGLYILGGDGGVFTFGDAAFEGSMPGNFQTDLPGNYSDYADIISDFLLWSGFHLNGAPDIIPDRPPVFGAIQQTGAYNSVGPIDPSTFDKVQIVDIIQKIRDVVGFIFRIREDGSAYFATPNIWNLGNKYADNLNPTQDVPVIDEKLNMTDYILTVSDQTLRSEILVAPVDPYLFGDTPNLTTVTDLIPPSIQTLHGMVKPAMIGVPLNVPVSQRDQDLLAELQALFCWLGSRTGQVTCVVDPAICPDDQIRIFDRATGETGIHYVVGVHTEHDLVAGTWLGTYSTQWLGDADNWAISANDFNGFFAGGGTVSDKTFDANGNLVTSSSFPISTTLAEFVAGVGGQTIQWTANNAPTDVTGGPTT